MLLTAFVIASYQYAQPDYGSHNAVGHWRGVRPGNRVVAAQRGLMMIWNAMAPAFFRGETLRSAAPAISSSRSQPRRGTSLRLPDSSLPDLIIAPDLSNLPEGRRGVGPGDGRGDRLAGGSRGVARGQEELAADREAADPAG